MASRRVLPCAPVVAVGGLLGAFAGGLLAIGNSGYFVQTVIGFAAVGANAGFLRRRSRSAPRFPRGGDLAVIGSLVAATLIVSGWDIGGLFGGVLGALLSVLFFGAVRLLDRR